MNDNKGMQFRNHTCRVITFQKMNDGSTIAMMTTATPDRGRPRGEIPDNFTGRIAENIIRLRQKYNLTVTDCAEQSGIAQRQWYRLEAGKHPQTTGNLIDQVVEFFEVDPVELTRKSRKR